VLLKKLLPANALVVDQDLAGEPRASTIMHNKFLIADGRWLWTGSTNISHTCLGAEYNANASIVVDSPELTALYEAEFRQMFEDFRFSIYKEELEHRPTIRYRDGTEVSVFFSPQDNAVVEGVVPFLNQARKSIDIAMFYLTHVDVVDALGQAVERGVKVRIIADAVGAAHPSSKVNLLRSLGVEVKVENWGGKMHMKAAIADGSHVIIGSMNWTEAGNTKNDENTMVIRKNKRVASELGGYFDSLWSTLKVVRTDARAESWQSINSCIDGIDNDHDGQTDQKDGACQQ
jgi:phosphatidylserine/phosphatidylglycerophosphate/cardiolipin synthase-like enzyme